MAENIDPKTVTGFGFEWACFDQSALSSDESEELFERYFRIFPWDSLPEQPVGFDLGCGSGRWARHVAPRVAVLHCIDASSEALAVARRNLADRTNCVFHHSSVDAIPLQDELMDFGYSLGVLHHVPDTLVGIRNCVTKLKKGSPFLLYLYYAFDNQPAWYRLLWRSSDLLRRIVSSAPHWFRFGLSQIIAALIYYPLARSALLAERCGCDVSSFPLSFYRRLSFYTMRTDALDRFGTRLEQRFTAEQIRLMMRQAGLENIRFSQDPPFWCAVGFRSF